MKKVIAALIILTLIAIGCTDDEVPTEQPSDAECEIDSDCATGGCSGQVCLPKDKAQDLITTCEYKPEYDCLKLTSCSCIEGRCQFEQNQQYEDCLDNTEPSDTVIV
jgi:eight-cysteine-cluster-containing protein